MGLHLFVIYILYKIHASILTQILFKCCIFLFLFFLLGRRAFSPPLSSQPGPCSSAPVQLPPSSARSGDNEQDEKHRETKDVV
jgi:hypothetical protein